MDSSPFQVHNGFLAFVLHPPPLLSLHPQLFHFNGIFSGSFTPPQNNQQYTLCIYISGWASREGLRVGRRVEVKKDSRCRGKWLTLHARVWPVFVSKRSFHFSSLHYSYSVSDSKGHHRNTEYIPTHTRERERERAREREREKERERDREVQQQSYCREVSGAATHRFFFPWEFNRFQLTRSARPPRSILCSDVSASASNTNP